MAKPRSIIVRKARELREFRRIKDMYEQVTILLKTERKKAAEHICWGCQQTGLIQQFWSIPPYSTLNSFGVNFVCSTAAGYFMLGMGRPSSKQFLIYPWNVGLTKGREELERILGGSPSFWHNDVPESIKQELINIA